MYGTGIFTDTEWCNKTEKTHPVFKHTSIDIISTTSKQVKCKIILGFDNMKLPRQYVMPRNFRAAIFRHCLHFTSQIFSKWRNRTCPTLMLLILWNISDGFVIQLSMQMWPKKFARSKMWSTPSSHQIWRTAHIDSCILLHALVHSTQHFPE